MPRDSNGIYTLPASNPVVATTEITTAWANPTLSDVAAALTGSLPRDGSAGMIGAFKVADGTVAQPGVAFTSSSTTGMWRDPSTPALAFSVGGVEALRMTAQLVTMPDQLTITGANDVADGKGQIFLNGTVGNRIDYNVNGVGAPTFTTRSVGTKLVLFPAVGVAAADIAIGVDTATLWNSVNATSSTFKWYGGNTLAASLSGAGNFLASGSLLSKSPTAGVGYATGAGGSVTQTPTKADTVVLDKATGVIVTANSSLAANSSVFFNFVNSAIGAFDTLLLTIVSTGNQYLSYEVSCAGTVTGIAAIKIQNITGGALSDVIQIKFTIIKGSNA